MKLPSAPLTLSDASGCQNACFLFFKFTSGRFGCGESSVNSFSKLVASRGPEVRAAEDLKQKRALGDREQGLQDQRAELGGWKPAGGSEEGLE